MFSADKGANHAFLLGNAAYGPAGDLRNPRNDVREVGRKLKRLGFKVDRRFDLGPEAMEQHFQRFLRRLDDVGGADTAIIYFAGHGFQDDGQNYLLSVPGPDGDLTEISLQRWITELGERAARRLVFLDACRNNLDVESVGKALSRKRAVADGHEPTLRAGFVEANYGTEILLSYSAAPGQVAADGLQDSKLSPYADALLRHIDAADLSLPVIMARVYKEVSDATDGRQLPWLSLALSQPFYFRPQPLLFLAGNLMAFIAFLMSLVSLALATYAAGGAAALTLYFSDVRLPSPWILALAGLFSGFALWWLIHGMNRAYRRHSGLATEKDLPETSLPALHGAIGGLLGGIIAGPIIALPYFHDWRDQFAACKTWSWFDPAIPEGCPRLADLFVEGTTATVFIATLLGWLAQHFSNRAVGTDLATLFWFRRRVTGAIQGGCLTGLIAGPVVTMYFGSLERPFLSPDTVSIAAVFAVALVAVTILNYSLHWFSWRRLARSFGAALAATVIAGLVLAVLIGVLALIGFIPATLAWAEAGFWNEQAPMHRRYAYLAVAGIPYGLVFGACLGLLIGLAQVLSEPWDRLASAFRRPAG